MWEWVIWRKNWLHRARRTWSLLRRRCHQHCSGNKLRNQVCGLWAAEKPWNWFRNLRNIQFGENPLIALSRWLGDIDKLKLYIWNKVKKIFCMVPILKRTMSSRSLRVLRVLRAKGTCSKSEGRLKHLRSVDDSEEEVQLFCCLSVGGFYIIVQI